MGEEGDRGQGSNSLRDGFAAGVGQRLWAVGLGGWGA